MIHESYEFDFPGRSYRFRHPEITHAADLAALRAIVRTVEPVVVEAMDEEQTVFHLVTGDEKGGTYGRDPLRTRRLEQVDEVGLVTWFDDITQGGAKSFQNLEIADGWYTVNASVGDIIRLHTHNGRNDVEIIDRGGRSVVREPGHYVLVAPFRFRLLSWSGEIDIALQWSAWTDPDGVGQAYFQQMFSELTAAGWMLVKQPSPENLTWSLRHSVR